METTEPVVNQEPLTTEPQTVQEPVASEEAPVTPATQPGSKTDPNLLLKSLQEEREKRRLAEEELNQLKSSTPSEETEPWSDEGKLLKTQISGLQATVESLKEERELEKVYNELPALKDRQAEFDEFRKEYPRHKLTNVAKLFLAEKDLLEVPARKGLEKPNGGLKTAPGSGLSTDEIKNLRETNYRKYQDMLMKGLIKP